MPQFTPENSFFLVRPADKLPYQEVKGHLGEFWTVAQPGAVYEIRYVFACCCCMWLCAFLVFFLRCQHICLRFRNFSLSFIDLVFSCFRRYAFQKAPTPGYAVETALFVDGQFVERHIFDHTMQPAGVRTRTHTHIRAPSRGSLDSIGATLKIFESARPVNSRICVPVRFHSHSCSSILTSPTTPANHKAKRKANMK